MKAAQMDQYGGATVVTTVSGAPKPTIAPTQVLVEVAAAGVNPFDWKVREGLVRQMAELTFPGAVLGGDFSGVVSEVGAEVNDVSIGDEVYGQAGALSSRGSFAQFAPVAQSSMGPKPDSLSATEAAALPLVGVSAYQALVEILQLNPGQKILIHGGAGGIGSVAIQLAKHLGAQVATTASASDADYVKNLGADNVIDYHQQSFKDEISNYDAVFDTIGGETFAQSFEVLRAGGAIVSMSAAADPILDAKFHVTSTGMFTQVTTARLAKLTGLVNRGVIKVHIDRTFPLEQAAEALQYLKTAHARGKVVIEVKP